MNPVRGFAVFFTKDKEADGGINNFYQKISK